MKKTLLLLTIFGVSTLGASGATLKYGLDFNESGTVPSNVAINAGTTSITQTTGYVNYNVANKPILKDSNEIIVDAGVSHRINGGSFQISDSKGINGLSIDNGIAISTQLYYGSGSTWRDAFSFTLSGCGDKTYNGEHRFESNGVPGWVIYNDSGSAFGNVGSAAVGEWASVGLNISALGIEVYINGVLTATKAADLSGAMITEIRGGSSADGRMSGSNHLMSQFSVYDGTLSANDYKYLSTHIAPQSIPEPTSASLGLLGLGALLLRRRRQA